MPKATKRGNSWRCVVSLGTDENGKRTYKSVTAATKAECEYLAALAVKDAQKAHESLKDPTVEQVIKDYIKRSEDALSPTTIQGYNAVLNFAFKDIMTMPVSKLDNKVMQNAINTECKRVAPKTVKNEYGLLSAALRSECSLAFTVKLPKTQHHIKELPPPGEVMQAIKGSDMELPCLLAMWLSFSLSEIRGLMCSDVTGDYITINRVMVEIHTVPTIKDNAKVETRLRRHRLPEVIKDLIYDTPAWKEYEQTGKDGFLVDLTRNSIQYRWRRICREHGFNMTFHDLRHMNASIMLLLGIPDKYAMERGGWSTDHVMKNTYMHTFDSARTAVDDRIDEYMLSLYK